VGISEPLLTLLDLSEISLLPDVYTNATIMEWMADEYNQIMQVQLPAVITGKPVHLRLFTLGREAETGQGVLFVLRQWAKFK
jgi:glutamate dehydrogenase (NADP+)